jgi:hypothetical protein
LPPSSAESSANLTPASGRQDHTTSPSASAPFVNPRSPRPPHPAPHPLWSRRGRALIRPVRKSVMPRISDSTRTWAQVCSVPLPDSCAAAR